MYIKKVRRVYENCGGVFFDFFLKFPVERDSLVRGGNRPSLIEEVIHGDVRIERDVQPRVVSLRGMPERERVRLSADYFSKKQRVIFPRADDILMQVALVKHAHGHFSSDCLPLFLY